MKPAKSIQTEQTDLATRLSALASGLRNEALALAGLASTWSRPGEEEHRDLDVLASSLRRTAALLDAAKGHLCKGCRLMEVEEHVSFGEVPRGVMLGSLKGGRSHGKEHEEEHEGEEGQGRQGARRPGRGR